MKKVLLTAVFVVIAVSSLLAQDKRDKEGSDVTFGEHLFTGGSIALGFSNNSFLVGGSPMFGYNLTNWADVGLVGNYNYTSYRDVEQINDKLRQSVYGGGGFVRLYPVRFLFAQAQYEHNTVKEKYLPPNDGTTTTVTQGANSFLIGAGYTSGRDPLFKRPFFYLSILFDVLKDDFSPYTNSAGNAVPIFKAGLQVPLFQGNHGR